MNRKVVKKSRGSVLFTAVAITFLLAAAIGSLLRWGVKEKLVGERHFVRMKIQNAVESIVSNGAAQLIARWENSESFPINQLAPNYMPLDLNKIGNFFTGTEIELVGSELIAGPASDGEWSFIDPTDPANEFDSQKGKMVFARNINIIGKAKGIMPNGDTVYGYARQILQVRDAPIFTHAVFYNLDLEYHPGPTMHMHGPVHTNGNLYGSAANNLYFHETVTAAKDYLHGLAPGHDEGPQSGTVWFWDGSQFVTDYKGSGSKTDPDNYYDSNNENWREIASNRWNGFLQTQDHGVPNLSPVGYKDYVRDDPETDTVDDDLNYAYAIIEPNLRVKGKWTHPDYKEEGEREKYARKAGMIIRIDETDEAPNNFSHKLSDKYYLSVYKIERENANNPNSPPVLYGGNDKIKEIKVKVSEEFVNNTFAMNEYSENDGGNPTSGFWDKRRNKGLDVLEMDIEEFRKAVDDTDENYAGNGNTIWKKNYNPQNDYNGIVYVELPWDKAQTGRKDKIVVSKDNMGVMLKNGSKIPTPSYTDDEIRDPGFTLATNNTMYVKGHFNADGNPNTGTANTADDPSNPEQPATIAADAITFLSENWDFTKSKSNNKNDRPASFTEVNTTMIQGLYPTGKGGLTSQSGGNHNFPRFLEKWSGIEFRLRTSMVALFEGEVANEPVSTSYYSPPIRNWGYYNQLSKGHFPPGTPNVRSFKEIYFRFLNESEYNALHSEITESLENL